MSTPHKASAEQWANIEKFVSDYGYNSCLLELRARVEALEAGVTCPHVRTSDEGTSYCALAEQASAPASAEGRPTVKARITRDRDETGDYLIMHDASPPASSLVERVTSAIDNAPYDEGRHQWDEARAAIREVAAWLRDRGGYPWAWVAQTLEQEADR